MNEQEINAKIKKAKSLRKKPNFFLSLFIEPDYIESGNLFSDVAFFSSDLEEKEKYYNEAATTYLMLKSEYGFFRAGEIYKKVAEVFEKTEAEKYLVYMIKYAENLDKAERYLTAGDAYMNIADKYDEIKKDEAAIYYKKACEAYNKEHGCPYHVKKARQKCLMFQLKQGDLEGAIATLDQLTMEYSKLCKSILCILLEKTADNELESVKENELIMGLMNKTGEDCIDELAKFSCEHSLPDYARLIFEIASDKFKPENDIC